MQLNKLAKKIFAAGLAVSLMMANAGVSFAYDPAAVTENPTFKTTITMSSDAKVPYAKINYTVDNGTAIPGTATTYEVIAGTETKPTIESVEFTAGGDPTAAEGVASVTETGTVDFKGVTFAKPGLYRYKITQSIDPTSSKGVTIAEEEDVKYLDVFVYDNAGTLEVKDFIFHKDTNAPALKQGSLTGKSDEFKVEYETHNLTFSKSVSGNQASRTKAFTFTLKIEDAVDGTVFPVKVNGEASENLTVANGIAEKTYSLKHGDSVEVDGLAPKTSYTISEAAEDYTASYAIDKGEATEGDSTGKQSIANADVTVAFTNTREGTIPTGVILDSAPFILIIGLAAAALVITAARKKSR